MKLWKKFPGGLSQGKNLTDLARRMDPKGYFYNEKLWKVLDNELKLGIEIEMEHTSDRKVAREIALDHLFEDPKYYTKFKKTGL
jgi:RNAse (barnase) inhibitor barstar